MTYYNEISKSYVELHREEQIKKIRLIKEHLTLEEDSKILDVGCGPCWTTEFFENVVGIDPAFKLLDSSKPVLNASAENLPFQDHAFDVVMSITAAHHFDMSLAIPEMKRVGKDKFIITVLKKAKNKNSIVNLLKQNFKVTKEIEEEKDVIYFLGSR